MTDTAVGVMGMGRVGRALVTMLARRGTKVHLYNRTAARAHEMAEIAGGQVAASPAELARECEVVCVCLAGWDATRTAYVGTGGLLDDTGSGRLFIDMGTLEPAQARTLRDHVVSKGHRFIYSPVSGRPVDLEEGRGFVMAAGDPTGIPSASAILSPLGTFRHVGDDPGHAAVMKLATNLLAFATMTATSEALGLATDAGIDRERALDVLEAGPARSALLTQRRESFLDPDSCEVQGPIDMVVNVYDMITAFADEVDSRVPQAKATAELFAAAVAAGYGQRDVTGFGDFLRDTRPASDRA
ncbi:NAD(P)-dependent oxidoreductase [Streptomyces sp. NPDC006355]|uniref:NAD(P)-dependent oxidoreductase n=1 Tax=Streptomyces sp. NPDC006355 TaxID=3156758 RepID=UPI0033B763D5